MARPPGNMPQNAPPVDDPQLTEVSQWVERELNRLTSRFEDSSYTQYQVLNVPPARPREGMVVVADGTNWNPGSGAGQYTYLGGVWHLSSSTTGSPTPVGGLNGQVQYNNAGSFGGLTDAQLAARINLFTSVLNGLVPASGGGVLNFLRADGTWVAPTAGGNLTVGTSTIAGGGANRILYDNAGVLGELAPGGGVTSVFLNGAGAWAVPPGSFIGVVAANNVTNIPSGPVTATDVQAALNQLASLIPAVGPGTDPLFLTHGLTLNVDNPNYSGNANDQYASRIKVTTDCSKVHPDFSDNNGLQIEFTATHGQATNGGPTTAKITFLPLAIGATYNASGQKFLTDENITSFGMSDTAVGQQTVRYSGGPVNGDEGQAFRLVSNLQQQSYLNTTNINTKPTQAVINTTTTAAITRSENAQTVPVASTAGLVSVITDPNQWVIVEQQVASGSPNLEPVKILAFTGGGSPTITGVFRYNHAFGVTVTPALRIFCDSTFQMGQDRVLVNLSAPSYSAGAVSAISGGGMDFTGTALNSPGGPVGGSATNIGAISLAADDCTVPPFDTGANRLRSWYQITQVTSPTHLAIHSFSVAGDAGYHGFGPGPAGSGGAGTYVIRPCARVLMIIANAGTVTGEIICETSTAPWNVGDSVEQAICPYADVTAFQYRVNHYTPGGAGVRSFLDVENWGARMWEIGISLRAGNGGIGQPTGDPVAMNTGILIESSNIGLQINRSKIAAIALPSGAIQGPPVTDAAGAIFWGTGNASLGPSSGNGGLTFKPVFGDSAGAPEPYANDALQFIGWGIGNNADTHHSEMAWGGNIKIAATGTSGFRPYMLMDWTSNPVNFERAFFRWGLVGGDTAFAIGTESGGSGDPHDFSLKTGGVEHIRFLFGDKIKFAAPSNFSANGTVATVLGSLGPAGASTTVQKWLTFVDNTGTTLRVPCF